jgi:hypothetical protein
MTIPEKAWKSPITPIAETILSHQGLEILPLTFFAQKNRSSHA